MPAFGNIVINDGASTPVSHTFSPVKIDGDVATWADRSSGVPSKYYLLSASNRDPSGGNGQVNREQFSVVFPVVADGTDPAVKAGTLLRTLRFDGTVLIPVSSTLQERKDVYAFIKNYLASSVVSSMIQDLEHVY
ncbi:TPA_asm: coat protein [ssRNA phage Esthiorhiza.3_8]|uniref:Coat protein n=2 Tax=Fiersviridae TaxID=2842319 RepID=A0A8S5L2I1_9VIRU|nr:coat protein [ssRNA phage Esthiorhiza.3_8]QDH91453.1 MAG: hypothetical protein H3RhizoLitter14667_000003 [Leviviridae sp.]DAD52030.1 TPA_asm: coat protein [ssRNA phage Esthiorhiza.3_8]